MLTDMPDLMEQFERLFSDTQQTAKPAESPGSTFAAPMPELAAPPVPLSEILAPDGSVVSRSLRFFAQAKRPDRLAHFEALAQQLAQRMSSLENQPAEGGRVPDFVYTVV